MIWLMLNLPRSVFELPANRLERSIDHINDSIQIH
ncbi:hypothetical protein EMIT043CA1_100228 [Pseudomonas brassicacearum]